MIDTCRARSVNTAMSGEPAATEHQRAGQTSALVGLALRKIDGSAVPSAWSLVRALASAGFLLFGALTSLAWLHLDWTTPFAGEHIELRETFAVSAAEQDVALLERWLPTTGKIGYLSEKPPLARFEARMRLAPLLLDYAWQEHDLVLVDFPVKQGRPLIESASYQMLTALPEAKSFARGMRIYRRIR